MDSCTRTLNAFPGSGNFCCLLITFANILDVHQDRRNAGPDVHSNCLTLCERVQKKIIKKITKNDRDMREACKITKRAKSLRIT